LASIRVISPPTDRKNSASFLKPPLSVKLRSGLVILPAGGAGERHSTESYEELIVILEGEAVLLSEDREFPFSTGQVCYVPPYTEHTMRNSGTSVLKYIYVVTKTT